MDIGDRDWRVEVTVQYGPRLRSILSALREVARHRMGQRVLVAKGEWPRGICLYAGTKDDAREAELLAWDTLGRHGLKAYVAVRRWNPEWRVWGGPEVVPAPTDDVSGTESRPGAGELAKGIGKEVAGEVGVSLLAGIAGAMLEGIFGG